MALDGACVVASQGFEPRLIGSEPTVLPLNEEALCASCVAVCSRSALIASRPPLQVYEELPLASNEVWDRRYAAPKLPLGKPNAACNANALRKCGLRPENMLVSSLRCQLPSASYACAPS